MRGCVAVVFFCIDEEGGVTGLAAPIVQRHNVDAATVLKEWRRGRIVFLHGAIKLSVVSKYFFTMFY